ncbi:hypothetical protein ACFQ1Q_09495 [Winogradskyella litorisediminis]|uniref:Riboflavin synthase subunit beta n=1 Tax=Winogradskyella litorisediminis TaxID=1156618 RepID=A0ABW3N800_9FLAO
MFNQKPNRKFNYKTRFSESQRGESDKELKAKWAELRGNTKRKGNFLTSLPALIIFLVAVFVLIYILNGYIK